MIMQESALPTRTRFAPSPTGYLHLGHIVSALYVWGIARQFGAEVILRIEDHDQQRSKAIFAEAILQDLAWLGFITLGQTPVFYQAQQGERYRHALARLQQRGLLYGCACSRAEVLAMSSGFKGDELFYTGKCRPLPGAAPASWEGLAQAHVIRYLLADESVLFFDRLCGQQVQTPSKQCGDFIVVDGKKNYSYHLANVVDDLVEDCDLIIRGEDILNSTGRQLLLRRSLDPQAATPTYYHHPLVYEENGKGKLSKLHQSLSIALRREQGARPEDIIGEALWQVGLISAKTPVNLSDGLEIVARHC